MAYSHNWRDHRSRGREDRQDRTDLGSSTFERYENRPPEGEGFQRRRGWRTGSDYYGDSPERYGPGAYDASASGASFNDRWENAYGGERPAQQRSDANPVEYQGQHRGRGPKGYRRSDERIREDACERLTDDDRIDASNVEVTVMECVVTLSGVVHSREEKRRAEDLIEQVKGVKDVENHLKVDEEHRVRDRPTAAEAEMTGTGETKLASFR